MYFISISVSIYIPFIVVNVKLACFAIMNFSFFIVLAIYNICIYKTNSENKFNNHSTNAMCLYARVCVF